MNGSTIDLTGRSVTLAAVVAVARTAAPVALSAAARARVIAARAVVERLADAGTPIYGLNSALGANTGNAVPLAQRAAYQERAIQARAVGVGPAFSTDVVRAMMFARICGMAVGGSGVSPAVLDMLLAMLNTGVHPVVPSIGSIGVADLASLSHLALPLLGQGHAEYQGKCTAGADALVRAGLKPVTLSGKDGVALISSNAATVGHAALVLHDCSRALDALNISAAMSYEGFRANLSPLDPRVQAAHPVRGQQDIAARLTALLIDSALWQHGSARRVQDPVSLRCVTQVHGAALAALWQARDDVELELNSASESPLVLVAPGEMLSNGNFHIPGLAIAFDALGIALAHTAMMCVQRCQRLYTPALSGLPLQLTAHGPEHSGFATIQKTLTSLYNQIRHLANPASLDGLPVSEAVEDHAPMAANVVAKTATMVPLLRYLAAIELMSAAQAIDLRPLAVSALGRGVAVAYAAVRQRVPPLVDDRPMGADVEAIASLVADGSVGAVDVLGSSG